MQKSLKMSPRNETEVRPSSPLRELLAFRNSWLWLLTTQMVLLPSFMSSLALALTALAALLLAPILMRRR
jgi:hypothetical protein